MDRVNTFSLGEDESSKYLCLEIDRKIDQQKHKLDHIVHFTASDCFDYQTKHTLEFILVSPTKLTLNL